MSNNRILTRVPVTGKEDTRRDFPRFGKRVKEAYACVSTNRKGQEIKSAYAFVHVPREIKSNPLFSH